MSTSVAFSVTAISAERKGNFVGYSVTVSLVGEFDARFVLFDDNSDAAMDTAVNNVLRNHFSNSEIAELNSENVVKDDGNLHKVYSVNFAEAISE